MGLADWDASSTGQFDYLLNFYLEKRFGIDVIDNNPVTATFTWV